MKRCPQCGETKPYSGYHKNRARSNGISSWCSECLKADHFKHREQRLAKMRDYDAAHAESHRARTRAWQLAHPERYKEQLREWQAKNHDYYFARQADGARRRRARKRSNGFSPYRREDIHERDGGICWLCDEPVPSDAISIDHVIPLCDGGPDTPENVALAHLACNVRRGRRPPPAKQLRIAL